MKNLSAICLCLLVNLPLSSQSSPYDNRQYGFTMRVPDSMTLSEPGIIENNGSRLNYAMIADTETFAITVVVNDLYYGKANQDQTQKMTRQQIDAYWNQEANLTDLLGTLLKTWSTLKDFRLYEKNTVSFDDRKALYLRMSAWMPFGKRGLVPSMSTSYTLVKNGILFSITHYCPIEQYEKTRAAASDSLRSFHAESLPMAVLNGVAPAKRGSFWSELLLSIASRAAWTIFIWVGIGVIGAVAALVGFIRSRRNR
jgi:hypothetical protein